MKGCQIYALGVKLTIKSKIVKIILTSSLIKLVKKLIENWKVNWKLKSYFIKS